MTAIQKSPNTGADTIVNAVPLTAVTVNVTGGNQVLTSATGDYVIDTINGVIHANAFAPVTLLNGGPDNAHTYVVRGTAGGQPVAFVGLHFVGATTTGTYKFAYNMTLREDGPRWSRAAVVTPITALRIAQQRPNKFVATAATGTYLHAPGFASQVIADDAVAAPGQHLVIGKVYTIAANGMPTTMNLQLDHITPVQPVGTLSVFYEIRADASADDPSE